LNFVKRGTIIFSMNLSRRTDLYDNILVQVGRKSSSSGEGVCSQKI
jgi:hypothetical protein